MSVAGLSTSEQLSNALHDLNRHSDALKIAIAALQYADAHGFEGARKALNDIDAALDTPEQPDFVFEFLSKAYAKLKSWLLSSRPTGQR